MDRAFFVLYPYSLLYYLFSTIPSHSFSLTCKASFADSGFASDGAAHAFYDIFAEGETYACTRIAFAKKAVKDERKVFSWNSNTVIFYNQFVALLIYFHQQILRPTSVHKAISNYVMDHMIYMIFWTIYFPLFIYI